MDEYLQCLYNYILEVRRDETLLKLPEYRMERISLLAAMRAMDAALSKEQQKAVNAFLSWRTSGSSRRPWPWGSGWPGLKPAPRTAPRCCSR